MVVFKGSKCRKPTPFKLFSYQVGPALKKNRFTNLGEMQNIKSPVGAVGGQIPLKLLNSNGRFPKKTEVPHFRMTWGPYGP